MRKKKKQFKLSAPVKYELLGVFLFTLGALSLLSLFGFHAGFIGRYLEKLLTHLFGVGAYPVPFVVMLIGLRYIWRHAAVVYTLRFFGLHLLFFSLLALYHHFSAAAGKEILPESLVSGGGLFGGMLLLVLRKCFGTDGAVVVLFAFVVGAVLLSTTWSLATALLRTKERAQSGLRQAREAVVSARARRVETPEAEPLSEALPEAPFEETGRENDRRFAQLAASVVVPAEREAQEGPASSEPPAPALLAPAESAAVELPALSEAAGTAGVYQLPEVAAILQKVPKAKNGKIAKEIAEKAKILEATLESFRVSAKIINACNGPAVTRYELEPAPGVKVSRIVNLADDLALKLAAPGVRIEAPIPGKAAIGIEVPNTELSGVHLREVLEDGAFFAAKSKLSVGLGIDIGGKAIVADLAKMPHLLVAGATGSGKSVCINTIITSILFKARPDEVKFILIDPKMVELSNYNGIEHLMVPVVIDAKKAASVLNWAVQEMERRYAMFAASGVRDMERYNSSESGRQMPMAAIVIIIDELADLMMVSPVDVEDAICRLAQKARAAGLHLVLATQRPSVDVITGIIKANVPSRISFAVSSQIDSRTILDVGGAEKLLGKGDMLYYPVGAAKPLRVQGAFISDAEVEALIEFIKRQSEPEENEEILRFTESSGEEAAGPKDAPQDELLEDAIRLVLETGQASASMLQRRFRVGYTRAARLIDTMEQMRIIGPNAGSKARDILMSGEQVAQLYFKKEA